MAETLRTVHKRGRGLLRGWWWEVGPKLVFDQMASPVPEIMDGSLYLKVRFEVRIKNTQNCNINYVSLPMYVNVNTVQWENKKTPLFATMFAWPLLWHVSYYLYYMFRPTWAIFRYHVYENAKRLLYVILTDPLSLHIKGNIPKIVKHWK
jgi:hypothetical protein